MTSTPNDAPVGYLAGLSLLSLSSEEQEALAADLQHILRYIAALDAVDVGAALPTYYGTEEIGIVRKDAAFACADAEELLSRAPERSERFIKVKGVFGNGA
jgi:aspartyl-tRNA(Asn)/glutamyl-tRNA(Gln) amidotransferase subunit C